VLRDGVLVTPVPTASPSSPRKAAPGYEPFGVDTDSGEALRNHGQRTDPAVDGASAQQLESLGQLAAGIAHDFNNLLAVILNYSEFVRGDLAAASESDWAQHVNSAQEDIRPVTAAAERAIALMQQLLAFGQRQIVQPQVIDLDSVIAADEEQLRNAVGDHILLITRRTTDLWPVLADPGQMDHVLMTLAINARDAMPDGGSLTIETHNHDSGAGGGLEVATSPPSRSVLVEICDTGEGMSTEVAARAFEPFFSTKDFSERSGLGLATVYGIIAQAGGRIDVESRLGVGTTFRIFLPITPQNVESA
jgi:signal transduction histidine kinase